VLSGLWRSAGYGWIFSFDSAGYSRYDVTRSHWIATERGSYADFKRAYDGIEMHGAHELSLRQAGDVTRYGFRRLAAQPDVPRLSPGDNGDPLVNFNALWESFDEHYAFFDLHRVNWRDQRFCLRPRVSQAATAGDLFAMLSDLLQPLDDGHVTLAAPGLFHQRVRNLDLRRALQATFATPNGRVTPRSTVDAVAARIEDVLLTPFAATRTPLQRACNDILAWCELQPGVGYLSVLRLFGFADTAAARHSDDLPHGRAAVGEFLRADISALAATLDRIFDDLRHCRGLIVDLRINGGGFDCAGLAIASRFAKHRCLAYSKRAKDGDRSTADQQICVEPVRDPCTMPVVVLTSPLCVSAGEVMALAMRALPQVTVVGQSTAGMLSDNLNKLMPNGWELSLSNEIYTSHDGLVFESIGIAPDVHATVMDAAQFVPALQASLRGAVDLLQR